MTDARADRVRWQEYVRSRSPQVREAIIRDYAILARRAVERLQITPWGCVNQDDLLSYAILGLLDAIERYDPEVGVPFEGFAMPRIRGAVLDALRQLDWVPRSTRAVEAKLRRAFGRLEEVLERPPTNEEVAEELGVTTEEVDRQVSDIARSSVLSLDDLVTGMTSSPTLGDLTPADEDSDPYRLQERGEAKERLSEAIETLPEREKLVVSLYYYHELTLKEIGKVLSVSEQRVSQIHARAMLRMSHKLLRHRELMTALAA